MTQDSDGFPFSLYPMPRLKLRLNPFPQYRPPLHPPRTRAARAHPVKRRRDSGSMLQYQ